ncbi:hypothetical protein G3I44_14205 [Halogeometricum borinquense]|uniref:Uncharacterized protein n=1 Tax=Halogeometricum borinquense TaxID=60847 RepID=A0A6C0UQW4_9EURY|nr:hypothetical protein [Halogeometricum borinquense]QIB75338.1 hypothetical protein G3I44_14205 [Halogeometricum borinquense]
MEREQLQTGTLFYDNDTAWWYTLETLGDEAATLSRYDGGESITRSYEDFATGTLEPVDPDVQAHYEDIVTEYAFERLQAELDRRGRDAATFGGLDLGDVEDAVYLLISK